MAEAVVERLESIDVDHQHANRVVGPPASGKQAAELNEGDSLFDLYRIMHNVAFSVPAAKAKEARQDAESILKRLNDLDENADYHARAVQAIIDSQLEPVVAEQVNAGGGGKTVFGRAWDMIRLNVRL